MYKYIFISKLHRFKIINKGIGEVHFPYKKMGKKGNDSVWTRKLATRHWPIRRHVPV